VPAPPPLGEPWEGPRNQLTVGTDAAAGLPGTLTGGGSRGGMGTTLGAAAAPAGGVDTCGMRPEPVNPGPVPTGGGGGDRGLPGGAGATGLAPDEAGDPGGAALPGALPGGAANGGVRGGLAPGGVAVGKLPEDLAPEAAGLPPSAGGGLASPPGPSGTQSRPLQRGQVT
jgi:hypothetical protein